MRRIACIGKLSSANQTQLCEQVLDIFNQSRIFNSSKQIHGIFLVQEEIILQVFEGNQDNIGEAIYKARRDHQIEDLTIIANYSCAKPAFSSWNMRYIRPGGHTSQVHLERIKAELEPHLKSDQAAALTLFRRIFPAPATDTGTTAATHGTARLDQATVIATENTSLDAEQLRTQLLSIRAWPKASQVKLSSPVMKACALMSKGKISYQELQQRCLWATETELTHFLSQLNYIGILVLAPMAAVANDAGVANDADLATDAEQVPASQGDRFGMLMKKFLTNTRLRVS